MASSSLNSGISGLKTSQIALNVIGDNLANLNTSGFKASRVSFANELTQTLKPALAPSGGLGGRNPIEVGTGATVSSIDKNFSQGTLSPTGRPLDLAMQGDGFFILTNEFQDFYTRVGAFSLDKINDLVDSGTGLKVKGVSGGSINIPVNSTEAGKATATTSIAGNLDAQFTTGAAQQVLTTNSPYTIAGPAPAVAGSLLNDLLLNTTDYVAGDKIDIVGTEVDGTSVTKVFAWGAVGGGFDGTTLGELRDFISTSFGSATAAIDGAGNIVLTALAPGQSSLALTISDASGNTGVTANPGLATTTTGNGDVYITTIPVFDTLGTSKLVTLTLNKTAANTWALTPTMKAGDGTVSAAGLTSINFNNNGSFSSVTGTSSITITYPDATVQTISLDFGTPNAFAGLVQFGGTSSAATIGQDGYEEGFFSSSTINQDGKVVALFTNGQTRTVGQIQLATFSNPAGLSATGNNLLSTTLASGSAVLKTALSGRVGSIVSGALESSNVDIAEEFTKLIISQRAFQANARTITTADEVLQELVSIVR
jgi:flagellar hook protein FlgE